MLSKLFNLVAILALATLISSSAFVGYLVASGALTAARAAQIAAVLRGEYDAEAAPEAHASTTQPAHAEPSAAPGSGARVHHLEGGLARDQLRRASLERAERDVRARQALLDQAMQQLITQQESFEDSKKEWNAKRAKLASSMGDEGFQRELQYVEKLAPKQAKEHILRAWQKQPADVVRLFNALDPGRGQKILEQFKSPAELDVVHALLEQLRTQQSDSSPAEERTSPADASP